MHPRPGKARARAVLSVLTLCVTAALCAGILYRYNGRFRSWFARDADNPQEVADLKARTGDGVPAPADAAVGWPQWRGPYRDGRPPRTPLRTDWEARKPAKLWGVPCGGGFSSFAVVGGRVYTQDKQGDAERVLCLDAETGKTLWAYSYPTRQAGKDRTYAAGPRATPTIDGDRLYAVGGSGKFVCLTLPAAGGQPQLAWEHDLLAEFGGELPQWGVACSPLVDGDLVVVQPGGRSGSVVAFDKATGGVRWTAGDKPSGYSSPIAMTVGGVRVVLAMTGDALLCVRAADGVVTAEYPWRTQHLGNIATPVVVGDYVFISSAYNKGCALLRAAADGDRVTLTEVYIRNNRVMLSHHSTCVYRDWHLYGFAGDTRADFRCVDLKTGVDVDGWGGPAEKGTLILADKHLVILTENGQLVLAEANPKEYTELARLPSGLTGGQNWALPVLVDGRLYLRDNKQVLCLDVRQ